MTEAKRVGVLTGGGDAPGLNPAIKGLVYRGSEVGLEVIGLFDGWRSLMNPAPEMLPLDRETVRRWDRDGGTNLGSSRTNPFKQVNRKIVHAKWWKILSDSNSMRWWRVVVRTHSELQPHSRKKESRSSACRRRSIKISPALTTHSASTPRSETFPK